ncbi:putative tubulin-tyrosine ligase family [Phytophthora cinnamomi]|uniref:putative tubulin-tyrosine ligase family n=1 Tax=Phytophthora cinnamomi TaxID=4785 RepID=UPI00355A3587|nr:putative tubulin-tyrosine ligase family [Phytophthora cinnamomi]
MAQLFAADDKFPDVVAALQARGWRRLPFVGCPKFDLKWTNYAKIAWRRVTPAQVVNHLQHSVLFSQKDHFADLLYAHASGQRDTGGQSQVDNCFPRTFDGSRPRDRILLRRWFVYSQAVAELKQSLCIGSTAQCGAALRLAKAVLSKDSFFERWREDEVGFEVLEWLEGSRGEEVSAECCSQEVKEVLSELERRDPQFNAVGIGRGDVWICKPSNLSQGRGITMCSSLEELEEILSEDEQREQEKSEARLERKAVNKWVVQKYIERPLLLQNGRKFDIRQWVLVTELEPKPIAFWFYKSYLRFCARRFQLSRLQDRFTHLSNYSVQQHFVPIETSDGIEAGRDKDAADGNAQEEKMDMFEPMWSSEQFRDILRQNHGRDLWMEIILPQMQSTARLALGAILPKLKAVGRGFEWLGFDFLVDENNHVWLLEVNVSPDVSHSTNITAELASKATVDALNVVLDPEASRTSDNGWLPFELN